MPDVLIAGELLSPEQLVARVVAFGLASLDPNSPAAEFASDGHLVEKVWRLVITPWTRICYSDKEAQREGGATLIFDYSIEAVQRMALKARRVRIQVLIAALLALSSHSPNFGWDFA